jgi:small nuclear ribonucleoprotein (snRNP)-like protein
MIEMSDDIYQQFIGKKVFVVLKSRQVYNGVVDSISEGNVLITDKFHRPVIFNISEISAMEVREDD